MRVDFSSDLGLIKERPNSFLYGVCNDDIGSGLEFAAR